LANNNTTNLFPTFLCRITSSSNTYEEGVAVPAVP
jgi:hypothetical protein